MPGIVDHLGNIIAHQGTVCPTLENLGAHAVEAHEALLRAQPQVAIGRLDHGEHVIARQPSSGPQCLLWYWVIFRAGSRATACGVAQIARSTHAMARAARTEQAAGLLR